jgi:nucleoside-diphosphate-sugar epimerase
MRALVTGVAGFIGSHLAEALLERGDTVVGVDCFTPFYDEWQKRENLEVALASPKFDLVESDLRTAPIEDLLDGVDAVFHQAAQAGVRLSWADGFGEYVSHNVIATQRLLEAVVAARPAARVVNASSSSVYGNQPRYPTREDDVPRPFSPYGVTKLAGEHLTALYAENRGISTVSLRYFTVVGPRQRPDMALHRLCTAALTGGVFPRYGDGSQIREFTYVGDIVRGNLAAAERDIAPGTYCNLAGGGEITLAALIELVGELAGVPVALDPQERQAGDAFRNGGSIERASEILDWEPRVSIREAVAAQLAWHKARV